jgi:hypothetical protein
MNATLITPLDFALAYACAGYRVIPVRGKVPLTFHGVHDASTDENKIREWWMRWPDANIGLTLEGLVAIDIDPRNHGDATLESLIAAHGKLPETCYAHTGGGGMHYLFRARNGTKYPGKLGAGIDVKHGAGAYIVVEPSIHASGEKYRWVDESEPWTTTPVEAPGWVARSPGNTRTENAEGAIFEGGRNAYLTSLAGTMRRRGMTPAAILAALQAENTARCNPSLSDTEIETIVKSVSRYEPAARDFQAHEWPVALNLTELASRDPQPPKSIMQGLPCGYVTATFAHGGTGKSQIEMIRAVCIAAGVPCWGFQVERRKVLFVSCEDRTDILHWRLTRICAHLGVDLASLQGWLHIIDLVGHASILFEPDPHTGHGLTGAYGVLAERMHDYGSEVLFLDGISDVYGGNENARGEVKQFINELLALIPADTGAVLLIGHVNKPTASAGTTTEGYSGSTAWHNGARARWFLYPETTQGEDGQRAARTGKLIFELQKSNHGEVGTQIEFEWHADAHLFIGRAKSGSTDFDRRHRDRTEQRAILLALKACAASNPPIIVPVAATGQRTAFQALALRPEFPETLRSGKSGRTRFWRHIEALRQLHAIAEASYRRVNRHLTANLVLTSEGVRQCVE